MSTFNAQTETVSVPTEMAIKRWEYVVTDPESHKVEQDILGDVEDPESGEITEGVVGTEMVPDGDPDLDIFIYVGGESSAHRRQVPREDVIAYWEAGDLEKELIKAFNDAV